MILISAISLCGLFDPPLVTVDRDNVEIRESCRVEVGGSPIIDADGNGVVHIVADNITVEFVADNPLHGAKADQTPDTFAGTGIVITGKSVTLSGAMVSGYKVGIHARAADELELHHCDVSNNFHQRLKSTPQAEDSSDWLWPHVNDDNEWIRNYGAGLCIEDSKNVMIYDVRARKTQNGIIFDRVDDSQVYDCDCSFLSGWGLALWRSNRNVISRNAFDFCVRGYSHGVYNRGQDSAGILMFEQCCGNVIAENSATHCGDGLFGFAGKEALGEVNPRDDIEWYKRRGNNGNLICANDFSYAVAHGLELTFSFDNRITLNRFVGNAICGIWGGYSQTMAIGVNTFSDNGDGAYGLERGGINIEHGRDNLILLNGFEKNACGVHLWWDDDRQLLASPWARANLADDGPAAFIRENTFHADRVALHLRDMQRPVFLAANKFQATGEEMRIEGVSTSADDPEDFRIIERSSPEPDALHGANQPRGARRPLWGRENIIMTEWGPWDHESPLLRRISADREGEHQWELLKAPKIASMRVVASRPGQWTEFQIQAPPASTAGDRQVFTIRGPAYSSIRAYEAEIVAGDRTFTAASVIVNASWAVRVFPWTIDPRDDATRWRDEGEANARASGAWFTIPALDLRYGNRGPSELTSASQPVKEASMPSDRFGTIATTSLSFPAGRWRINTLSDDGILVQFNGHNVIDDWTWHGPTEHVYEFTLNEPRDIQILVLHFELDGYAVLKLDIEPH